MSTKETNPKDAIGTTKVPFSTIPAQVMAETGLALMEGALKYGRHNYRTAGVRASVYYDAALRHLTAFWEGQNVDPDSGLPHVVKAIACLTVLRDSQIQGNWTDDRPPATPGEWVQDLNLLAKDLLDRYPNPLPAHTALDPEEPKLISRIAAQCAAKQWERDLDAALSDDTAKAAMRAVSDLRVHHQRWMLGDPIPPVDLDEPPLAEWEKELIANASQGRHTFQYLNDDCIPADVRVVKDKDGDLWHRVSRFCDSDTWTCDNPDKSISDEWSGWFTEVIV